MGLRDFFRFAAAIAMLVIAPAIASAQLQQAAGVVVDADGVLRTRLFEDPTGELTRERLQAARSSINPDVAVVSKLRKISLNRLEKALAQQIAEGRQPTEDMKFLAGLSRDEIRAARAEKFLAMGRKAP